jgi:hypothetical protein
MTLTNKKNIMRYITEFPCHAEILIHTTAGRRSGSYELRRIEINQKKIAAKI